VKPIRVLVVDDSASMRGLISLTLSRDPDITVVGEAANAMEARQAIKALVPDVMTLDVQMPKMDGLEFLEKVMRLRPFPVVMVSSQTAQGAAATIEALELGAVCCVSKPSANDPVPFAELPAKVKSAAGARVDRRIERYAPRRAVAASAYQSDGRLVAIGVSTGGVEALVSIIAGFPRNCPPTAIVIHMPSPFTASFARRLGGLTEAEVDEAKDGAVLGPGRIVVAPGGATHLEIAGAHERHCRLRVGEPVNGHRPSVDVLFESVAKACGAAALGVILTGMGKDGAKGLLAMRRAGAQTLGQNEATSTVYGMPKAAFELGAVEKQVSLQEVASSVLALTSAYPSRSMNHVARG
jgi:two-component system, chemotaxis family, protein-glutamate methylesterase/glutaminase